MRLKAHTVTTMIILHRYWRDERLASLEEVRGGVMR